MSNRRGHPKPYGTVTKIRKAFDEGAGIFTRSDVEELLYEIDRLKRAAANVSSNVG